MVLKHDFLLYEFIKVFFKRVFINFSLVMRVAIGIGIAGFYIH